MKKLISALLVLMMLASFPSALAGSNEAITLTLEHQDSEKPERAQFYEDVAAAYMALHPNVTIEITKTTFSDAQTTILTALSAGEPFDMFEFFVGDTKIWLGKDALLPLTGYFEADGGALKTNYIDGIVDLITYGDGQIYTMPLYCDTTPICYNKQIFEKYGVKPPATKEEFYALCDMFKAEGFIPFQLHGSMVDDLIVVLTLQFAARDGLDPFAIINGKVPFTDPWYVDAVSVLKEMYDRGYLPESFWTISGTEGRMAYSTGGMPMKFGFYWDVDTHFGMGMPYEIQGVASFPDLTQTGVKPYTVASACSFGISKYCKNPDVAVDFLTFLTNMENQTAMAFKYFGAQPNGMPVVNKGVALSDYAKSYAQTLAAGTPTVFHPTNVSLKYMDTFGTNIPLLMQGQMTVAEFAAAIDALR